MKNRDAEDLRERAVHERPPPVTFKAAVIIALIMASGGILTAVAVPLLQGGESPSPPAADPRMAVFLSSTIPAAETDNGTYLNLPVADCIYLLLKGDLVSEEGPISEMQTILSFLYGGDPGHMLVASSPGLGEREILRSGNETSQSVVQRLSRSTRGGIVGIEIIIWEDVE